MILWPILFFLIIGISFLLALRSMRDFEDIPAAPKIDYGLFLVRRKEGLDAETLDALGKLLLDGNLKISFERLIKNQKAALTIFGPKNILDKFYEKLNLLELEDYMQDLDIRDVAIWEVGLKNTKDLSLDSKNEIFEHLSHLDKDDQFFWQVVIGPVKKNGSLVFRTQIRAVTLAKDPGRRKLIVEIFQDLKFGELEKIPRMFSSPQMLNFYRLRSLTKDSSGPVLTARGIIHLLKV